MCAFPLSAHYNVPVVDGDDMGRAFPTLSHGKLNLLSMPVRNAH